MTILVTRPVQDAAGVIARLRSVGLSVLHAPMMQITSVAIPRSEQDGMRAVQESGTAYLVFTSANGVRALVQQMPDLIVAPCFCVGQQTAQCAREAGFQIIHTAWGDVASLLASIEAMPLLAHAQLFHLCAQDHRGALVTTLIRKHYNARAICAYNAERATVLLPEIADAIGTGRVQGVLLYSPRTARLFEQLLREAALQEHCTRMTAYGLSRAVVRELTANWARVWSSLQPDPALLEAQVIEDGNKDKI